MTSLNCYNNRFISRELQMLITNNGIITDTTANCYEILGYINDELINKNISELFKINSYNLISNKEFSIEFTRRDGLTLYLNVQVTQSSTDNETGMFYLSIIDISKYKELENRDKLTLRMLKHAKDLVCRLELIPEMKFTYLSSSVEDFFGYTLEDCLKNPMLPFEIVHPDDKELQLSKIKPDTDFSKLIEVRMKHKNGYYIWVEDYVIPHFNEYKQLIAVETICRNIQSKKELEERLEKLGYIDGLTGLYNKNYFLKEMNSLNTEMNIPVGIILCDLDNLKFTNDSFGHSKGDTLIKNASEILQSVFEKEHVISRIGGDEFVVIVKNKSSLEITNLFTKLEESIKIFNKNNKSITVEMSVGLSYTETSISKMQSTLDIADTNMYKNKKSKNPKYSRLP